MAAAGSGAAAAASLAPPSRSKSRLGVIRKKSIAVGVLSPQARARKRREELKGDVHGPELALANLRHDDRVADAVMLRASIAPRGGTFACFTPYCSRP